jgi:outer membrane immunogenic protein
VSDTETVKMSPIFTATLRLGYAWDRWLAYIKGGYAGADVEFRAFDRAANVGYQQSNWLNGYALGLGLEYAFTNAIRFGVDYTFIDLMSETESGVTSAGFPERYKLDGEIHSVTARLNFLIGRERHAEPLK